MRCTLLPPLPGPAYKETQNKLKKVGYLGVCRRVRLQETFRNGKNEMSLKKRHRLPDSGSRNEKTYASAGSRTYVFHESSASGSHVLVVETRLDLNRF